MTLLSGVGVLRSKAAKEAVAQCTSQQMTSRCSLFGLLAVVDSWQFRQ